MTWSQQIHGALSTNEAFPSGACNKQINMVKSHSGGHGCKAPRGSTQSEHPACHPHPTTGTRNPPRQCSSEALSSCFCQHLDCLQLQAFLKDVNQTLDNKSELEDFIDGTVHKTQIPRLIREDRKSKVSQVQMQFLHHRIAGTLERPCEDCVKPDFSTNP